MNKVFKVIWSEARNAYVVVSEIAKNHGSKSCSTKKLLTMLIATGVMTCASMAPAMAATNVDSNANVTVKKGATVTVAENATVTVGDNAIVLGKGASAVKDSVAIGSGASVVAGNNGSSGVALGNKAHAGYKGTSLGSSAISGREGTTLVGANTNSASLYTTVVGTDSVINSDGTSYTALGRSINVQGAAATVVGSKNTVDNKNGKVYSGVANNVMGSANTIEASNGVTIQGIGNKVTDAYKDMNISIWEAYTIGKGDYSALAKKESGAVAVVGGANTVSKQTDSTVIGYDNKLTGDKEKGSQNVFMAGSHNELNNVSDSLVMGNKNAITGVSNVISFGYQNAITANNAVAIGNSASVSAEGGVALGAGSVADRANAVSVGSKGAERQIINVKEGVEDTDAVNVSQLKDVKAEALKHTTVTDGANITVTPEQAADGRMQYNVALKNDITLAGDDPDAFVSISGSRGTIWASGTVTAGSVAAGDVFMDGDTATVSGLSNKTTAYDGFATTGKAATEEQLKEVATEAGKHTTVTDGANITVTEGLNEDGGKKYKVALNNDILLSGDNDAFVNISGSKGTIWTSGSVAAGNVVMDGATATVSGLGNTTTAYDGFANGKGKAATEEQLKEISKVADNANQGWNLSTNGGEASKVAPGETVDFSGDKNISVSHDGTKVKVELNKDIDVNSVQTNALNSKYNLSVGTMAENGIMPFFVNSTGAFYAAHNKFSVDKDGNVNANSVQTNALNSKYNLSVGTMAENGIMPFFVNSTGAFYAANNNFSVDKDGKVIATAGEIGNVVLQNGVYTGHSALRDGELFVGDASGNYSQITTKGAKLGKVTIAEDGKISGVAAGEVSSTSTDAINGSQLHQTNVDVAQNKADIAQNKADIAQNKADIAQNKADIAQNKADIAQNKADIAALDNRVTQNEADIAQNKADIAQNKTDIKNLDNRVTNVEELAKKHTTVTAGDNITVTEDKNADGGKEYKVALSKDITVDSVKAGDTTITDKGLEIKDGPSVTKDGIYAGDKKITGVAKGEVDTDAVNVGQLKDSETKIYNRIDGVENKVNDNTNRINKLGSRVNKVGAGAAALAALHPMDFDPDDKLTFSAGYGNYAGENAAAIGAYYRPDEKVMFSVAGTVGNGENMVNAGVSFALDRTNHVSNSRTALAREVIDLRGQLAVMGAKMAKMEKAFGMLDETKTKLFPDVPANHWAYEYIAKLAGNGYIEGYPDGNFGGDRLMTRYEFAAMLYRAIENGAALEEKIIKEFEPELGRIRVDRISGEDGDRDKIERVRVNDTKGERDHYGNKLAK